MWLLICFLLLLDVSHQYSEWEGSHSLTFVSNLTCWDWKDVVWMWFSDYPFVHLVTGAQSCCAQHGGTGGWNVHTLCSFVLQEVTSVCCLWWESLLWSSSYRVGKVLQESTKARTWNSVWIPCQQCLLWFSLLVKSIPRNWKGWLGFEAFLSLELPPPLDTAVFLPPPPVCTRWPWQHSGTKGCWGGSGLVVTSDTTAGSELKMQVLAPHKLVSLTIKDCLMWTGVSDLRCEKNRNTVCYVTLSC